MERGNIDRPAFTGNRERRLHLHDPTKGPEPRHERFDEACVRLIEEPVQPLTVPPQSDIEVCVKRFTDPTELGERQRPEAATLD